MQSGAIEGGQVVGSMVYWGVGAEAEVCLQ
jgi:hypothetical protein